MTERPVYLDTNIIIYAFESNDALAKALLKLILSASSTRRAFLATSELSLAELVVEPLRSDNSRLTSVYENLTLGNAFIRIGTVSREVLWNAVLLRAADKTLRLPDAIHVSTAFLFGCSRFLSGDRGLKPSYTMPSTRPMQLQGGEQISLVRPELAFIDTLLRELE